CARPAARVLRGPLRLRCAFARSLLGHSYLLDGRCNPGAEAARLDAVHGAGRHAKWTIGFYCFRAIEGACSKALIVRRFECVIEPRTFEPTNSSNPSNLS